MECGDKNLQVFSMDLVYLKAAWNRVMLTPPFRDANNIIVHVATTVCEKEYAKEYKYLEQNVIMKFHELGSVFDRESTTCFTDGHKRSDAALPAVCPFTHVNTCYSVIFTSRRLQQHEKLARRQGHSCLRFFHDFVRRGHWQVGRF